MARVCENEGCEAEVVGRSDKQFCCTSCQQQAWSNQNPEKRRNQSASWHAANAERARANRVAWRKANPDKKRRSDERYRKANRDKERARSKQYYLANIDRERSRNAEYQKLNPEKGASRVARRRARKACAVQQRWVKLNDVPDDQCYWCGTSDVEHLDHLMPISLGGPAEPYNEAMTCASCNLSKGGKHPLVWIAELVAD